MQETRTRSRPRSRLFSFFDYEDENDDEHDCSNPHRATRNAKSVTRDPKRATRIMILSENTERNLKETYLKNLKVESEREIKDEATDYLTGSYFRNQEPQMTGLTPGGKPVDARYLFDRAMLADILHGIFNRYYEGFVGEPFAGKMPLNIDDLSSRMIEEMGVDRHMQELLRVVDQTAMTDDAFGIFLRERGYTDENVRRLKKGQQDLLIQSGPHLGGFNEQISLPEMIEAVATMSALCIAGRFWQLKIKG